MFTFAPVPAHAGPATTTVTDIVYRADGTPASGKILISWPSFTAADGKPVAAGTMSIAIAQGGGISLALVPNEGSTPGGTYYKVVLKLDDGTTETEYWSVPRRTPVKVSDLRSEVVPASVAVQMASRNYVDSSLSTKADDGKVLHVAGDEAITGVKQFSLSPLVPMPTLDTAVANKSYVDSSIASIGTSDFLRKSGDTMLGTLTLVGDPSSANHAANRHYVDLQIAGLTSSVAQKLGRQNDTPVTLGGIRFASQFPTIQAAIEDAGTTGTVLIPNDYSRSDSFTNPNRIPVIDLRGDASTLRGVYDVRDFGATPDDNTDDWAAIQAAIDAASIGAGPYGTVYVPRGTYRVSKPLHITKGIRFSGAGRGVTTITGYAAEQGAVMVVSPGLSVYPGLPTGPALTPGSGTSMYLNGTSDYFLNLRESGVTDLNGRSSLTVEFFYKPDFSVPAGSSSYNLISSSGSVTGQDGNTALAILHGENNQINAWLNVAGAMVNVNSGVNSILQGNTYHVALTYDGAQLRLFLNGTLKDSKAVSGAIFQKAGEDLALGPKLNGFMEANFDSPMVKGWVDSVRLSNTARYTATFATPAAKLGNDGNTLFLLNFDNNYDQFTVASSMYGPSHLFLRRFGGGYGQVGNFHLSDISFIGSGPEFMYMITSMIDNVEVTASRRGLQFINNCYLNRISSLRVIGQEKTQFGLGIGAASGVLIMTDINLAGGHYPLFMDAASASIHGLWIELSNGTEIGAVLRGLSNHSIVINHPVIGAETGPTTVKYGIAAVGVGSVVLNGGVLETSNAAPWVGLFGNGSFIHNAGYYSANGALPPHVFQVVVPPLNPVHLVSPTQAGTNLPWSNNMAYMRASAGSTGYTLTMTNIGANTPGNASTYFFGGNLLDANNTSFDAAKLEIPKSGTIRRIQVRQNLPNGSAGSGENVVHKVCINNGTTCFGSASFPYNSSSTAGTDITLNQPVAAGDTIAFRVDTPSWATKPTNVRWHAVVYVE